MITVLGIDPGSRITGYALIRSQQADIQYLQSGCIRAQAENLPERLGIIFNQLQQILAEYAVDEMAIERVFVAKNADSALKLGQARGAAICAVNSNGIPVYEYTANQVKQAVVGRGHADKRQVQHMVRMLLKLEDMPQADAADALAIAICHANTRRTQQLLQGTRHRYPDELLQAIGQRRSRRR